MPLSHPLSLQLYSARKVLSVAAQLATTAAAGFTNVELFAPFYEDIVETQALLAEHGLSAISGHFAVDMAEGEPSRVADIARALGIAVVVLPYLAAEERPADAAGWALLGRRLAAIAERLGREGLRVAWHNHDFEFAPLPDGSTPLEHLLGDRLLWEADLAWIVKGRADPAAWIARYRGRIPLVHVKDLAPPGEKADEDGWADVGAGVLPWRRLWGSCLAAGAEAMIAEHDNPSDFSRFARTSAEAMRLFEGKVKQ